MRWRFWESDLISRDWIRSWEAGAEKHYVSGPDSCFPVSDSRTARSGEQHTVYITAGQAFRSFPRLLHPLHPHSLPSSSCTRVATKINSTSSCHERWTDNVAIEKMLCMQLESLIQSSVCVNLRCRYWRSNRMYRAAAASNNQPKKSQHQKCITGRLIRVHSWTRILVHTLCCSYFSRCLHLIIITICYLAKYLLIIWVKKRVLAEKDIRVKGLPGASLFFSPNFWPNVSFLCEEWRRTSSLILLSFLIKESRGERDVLDKKGRKMYSNEGGVRDGSRGSIFRLKQ